MTTIHTSNFTIHTPITHPSSMHSASAAAAAAAAADDDDGAIVSFLSER